MIKESRRARQESRGSCDAAAVVAERLAYWSMLAGDQDRRVTSTVPGGPLLAALPQPALVTCVDALLANVFAHTPKTTAFEVRLTPRPQGGAVLEVSETVTPAARAVASFGHPAP
ncbi:hypothetical protein [Microbispora sp. NPDC049125]|uniref:hypothetical protein n=1 Tax=Microbispora sp. NPDC049125 TaxID=3154929 RepID=UPI003467C8A2